MTTAAMVPSQRDRVTTIRELILKNREQITMALPRHLNTDRLIRTMFTELSRTPKLIECSPRSLLGALIQCAQLGLEPGLLGMAYLVPFRDRKTGTTDVQLIVGYKGLLALARRSQEISTIQAHVVRVGDTTFHYRYGLTPTLDHQPSDAPWETEEHGHRVVSRPVTHVYAVARLKDGGVQFEVMTTAEIEQHCARYSRAAQEGPWVTHWEEMAKKTVLRRLAKLLPASVELHAAVALDETAEAQIPQHLGDLVGDAGEPAGTGNGPAGKLDQLTEELKREAPPAIAETPPAPDAPPAAADHELFTGPANEPAAIRQDLIVAISAEQQRWERQPSAAQTAAILKGTLGTADLTKADPAALGDLLALYKGLTAKDPEIIRKVNALVKGTK